MEWKDSKTKQDNGGFAIRPGLVAVVRNATAKVAALLSFLRPTSLHASAGAVVECAMSALFGNPSGDRSTGTGRVAESSGQEATSPCESMAGTSSSIVTSWRRFSVASSIPTKPSTTRTVTRWTTVPRTLNCGPAIILADSGMTSGRIALPVPASASSPTFAYLH